MKTKLKKTVVEALELPGKGQVFVWDTELTGFAVKLTPTGRTYVAERRVNGKTRRVTIGKHGIITTDQARKKAIVALAEMTEGVDVTAAKRKAQDTKITLRQVVADYIANRSKGEKTLRPATLADFNKHLTKSFEDWQDKPITFITRDKVEKKHKELSDKSAAQADLAFRYLKAWLNFARAKYRADNVPILPENPVAVLNKSDLDTWNRVKPRENRIPDEHIGAAWNLLQDMRRAQISSTAADVVCFLLLTGCRWREAAELTWGRVDLEKQTFDLPDPKNKRAVKLPLSGALVEILKERQQKSGFVFPARTKTGHISEARTPLEKISAMAGSNICHHDLRRTFTNIAWKQCRIDLSLVRLLTNHKMSGDVTVDVYGDAGDLRFLLPEADRVAGWVVEQGQKAIEQEAGK